MWSYRPLILWLKLVGVPTMNWDNYNEDCSVRRALIRHSVAVMLLVANMSSNILIFFVTPLEFDTTGQWSSSIDRLNFSILMLLSHWAMMIVGRHQDEFVHIFRLLEQENLFQEEDFLRIRKVCKIGILVIMLVTTVLSKLTIHERNDWNDTSGDHKLDGFHVPAINPVRSNHLGYQTSLRRERKLCFLHLHRMHLVLLHVPDSFHFNANPTKQMRRLPYDDKSVEEALPLYQ